MYVDKGVYYSGGKKEVDNDSLEKSIVKRHMDERTLKGPLIVLPKNKYTTGGKL